VTDRDPLSEWPEFLRLVRRRLEIGRQEYGDASFGEDPEQLLAELQAECMDLAGWGYVLWHRLERARRQLQADGRLKL